MDQMTEVRSTLERAPAGEDPPAEPLWVLRINPLGRSRAGDGALLASLAELVDAERAVVAAAGRCADELYEHIGSTVDVSRRRVLIAQRRAVHNDRDLPEPMGTVGPATARWIAASERRSRARRAVAAGYADAIERERSGMATVLGDEHLLGALALVAPEVFTAALRYRTAVDAGGELPARVRKSERGLVQYVTRAMVRTSPLSRFTAVGLAVPHERGTPPDRVTFDTAVAFLGLDRVMLGYVLAGLRPDEDEDGWVQVPPTTQHSPDGSHLYFLRFSPSAGVQRMSARLTPTVQLLLDATAMGPRRVSAVAAEVAGRSGRPVAEATTVVRGAVRAGLLCTAIGPDDSATEIDALLDGAGAHAGTELIAEVRQRRARLATADPTRRDVELERTRAALARLSELARRPATILVEEDYVVPPSRITTAPWRPALDDLAAGVELLSLFDRLHDVRALLAAAFVDRFGAGADVPLAQHAAWLVDEVARRGGTINGDVRPDLGPADGSLQRLHALRERVAAVVHDRIARQCSAGADVVLSAREVTELVADLPGRFRDGPLAYGVLVQPWQANGVVFNDAYSGHGMLFGRFLGADRALGGTALRHQARRLRAHFGADGSRVVEDRGLYRLNVNAHMPVLPDALHGDDWYGLRLAHDRDTDQLVVQDRDSRPLRVMTLGGGHPELVPPPLRIATWLVTGGRLIEHLVETWHRATGWDGERTRAVPRLLVGTTMLARRRWYGGSELGTAVAAGPSESDRLLALTAWRARHGVSEEVVLKTPIDAVPGPDEDGPVYRNQRKPQYVDLTSALHVRVLPRLLQRRDAGYLEEALPAVADGGHAFEWIVEIGRRSGGPFHYGGSPA
jgi:hypothetical protein